MAVKMLVWRIKEDNAANVVNEIGVFYDHLGFNHCHNSVFMVNDEFNLENMVIPCNWDLIDSQLTIIKFSNPDLLRNIWYYYGTMIVPYNVGPVKATKVRYLPGFKWTTKSYHLGRIANVIYLAITNELYRVMFGSTIRNVLILS